MIRIFVLGRYQFLGAHSFPRASLSDNCSLLGTDNVRGRVYFRAKWRLLFIYTLQHKIYQILFLWSCQRSWRINGTSKSALKMKGRRLFFSDNIQKLYILVPFLWAACDLGRDLTRKDSDRFEVCWVTCELHVCGLIPALCAYRRVD